MKEVSLRDSYTTDGTEITVTIRGGDGHTYGPWKQTDGGNLHNEIYPAEIL